MIKNCNKDALLYIYIALVLVSEIRFTVALTKVDELCPKTGRDITYVFKSDVIGNSVKTLSERLSLDQRSIIPIQVMH